MIKQILWVLSAIVLSGCEPVTEQQYNEAEAQCATNGGELAVQVDRLNGTVWNIRGCYKTTVHGRVIIPLSTGLDNNEVGND